ncbi:PKD domain-containing protein [Marinoscillum sp. MHG1-6]|uniref:PKD domain-containing protein n=1 Tax=Marinoscillum sp. MHG1-6 TaxID=2959627 RepID=UPI002158A0F5|nr:PKD domain-containing protein [Marinoscillum sp. MHG1-6]
MQKDKGPIQWRVILFTLFIAIICNELVADPTAAFSYSFPLPCQGEGIQFTNNSSTLSGTIVLIIWDFGDGNSSAVSSPTHIYEESGNFTVKLTIQNSNGDFDMISKTISVNPIPQVNFQLTGTNQCESVSQGFDNLSSVPSNDLTFEWDFGDGNTSTDVGPTHLYENDGTYNVILIASSASTGCESSISKQVIINPEESIDFLGSNACLENSIDFVNESSKEATDVEWLWDFDDGNISTTEDASYSYSSPGAYNVTLQATTDKGCITSASKWVNVFEQPVAAFEVGNGCSDVDANFINESQYSDNFTWYFGDGNISHIENPTHHYDAFGTYDVALVSTNSDGCSDSTVKTLSIYPVPTAGFTVESVCQGSLTSFNNTSQISSGTISYQWDFGDGQGAIQSNPQHTYSSKGTYLVKLKVKSEHGCSSVHEETLTVYEQPAADFLVADVCADSSAEFVSSSIGSGIVYEWSFGDGESSSESNPTHEYGASGTYPVRLKIQNENGCWDVHNDQVIIKPLPNVDFSFSSNCDTITVPFKNLSFISSGGLSYNWSFGDGNTSSELEPYHRYEAHGTYQVKLNAVSDGGCSSQKIREIDIYARPVADFSINVVCDGEPTIFNNASSIEAGSIVRYLWDFGDGSNSIVADPEKQYLNSGDYKVSLSVFSEEECESKIVKTTRVLEIPIANFTVDDVCLGLPITPVNLSSISSGDLQFHWDFGDGTISESISPEHSYTSPGVYTITLSVISSPGCMDQIKKDVRVYAKPVVVAGSDTSASLGFSVQLSATGALNYLWYPVHGLNNSSIPNPLATPDSTTTYFLEGTDQYGCKSLDSLILTVVNDFKLLASNVFTPDGNGQNDTWVVENVESFGSVHVRVYDRYGTLVFQDHAYQNDWYGVSGKDILPDGTYYYLITFSDSSKSYKGAVTILRNK